MENHSDISSSDIEKTHNSVDMTAEVDCCRVGNSELFALDNTITANIQAEIFRDFQAANKLSWISAGLVMSASATVLLWGKIFFQFNTKWTYIISVAIFEIGSAVCGSAPNMDALIVATTTLQEQPMYVASTGMTWGLGMVLGPIVGGGFSQSSVGWRWAFYINLLIGAVCAPVYLFLIPNIDPRNGVPLATRAREIDWLGRILNLGAFLSGIMPISFGGLTWAWGSGNIIGLFVCSGVLFILFGPQQVFIIAGTACFVPVYFVPLFFQFTRGDGALDTGVRLLPFIIPCIVMICVNGGVMSAYGLYMPWYTIGGAIFYTVGVDTSAAHIYGYSILTGLGTGMYLQASFSVSQASVALDMVASASGFITRALVVGTTIALAIANSAFSNESQKSIIHLLPNISIQEVEAVISGTSTLVSSLPAAEKVKVESAIVDAMGETYILVIVAGALTLLLGLAMKRERLFLQAGAAA
ncbi:MFS drug efflux transporter [Penicillium fimorum]|uniref:MFS drug efflux transporter n=1 Tax=Penicillium fimorum TaxID=1882269 RepID=A0A9W9Y4B1_9EURO|nr:MFS drug efflux transporter [Penicillium fimorum]